MRATPCFFYFCGAMILRLCLEAQSPHYFEGRPRDVLMSINPSYINFLEGRGFISSYVTMKMMGLLNVEGLLLSKYFIMYQISSESVSGVVGRYVLIKIY